MKTPHENNIFVKEIYRLKTVSSTNDFAKSLILKGAKSGTVIVSERQTKGRGRKKRSWESPKGGLWFSIILYPPVLSENLPLLTLMSAIAVTEAILEFKVPVYIKWPNDLLINNKKVCGILSESITLPNNAKEGVKSLAVIIGIGVNVNNTLDSTPEIFLLRPTSLINELGKPVNRNRLLNRILDHFSGYYTEFISGNFPFILNRWRSLAKPFLGQKISIKTEDGVFEGVAEDINEKGSLILRLVTDNSLKIITAGDVALITEEKV
ncbi:MAG: biotin--[acetyl-CoA-carboxylase] ligase [Candidatus Hermodarchaeota archaeon]